MSENKEHTLTIHSPHKPALPPELEKLSDTLGLFIARVMFGTILLVFTGSLTTCSKDDQQLLQLQKLGFVLKSFHTVDPDKEIFPPFDKDPPQKNRVENGDRGFPDTKAQTAPWSAESAVC